MNEQAIRLIIAGGRNFNDRDTLLREASVFIATHNVIEIVSGKASGADALGEEFARREGIKIASFPADWKRHGRAAGPIRNSQMAAYANALLAFWDGESKGTKNMIETAKKRGLLVEVVMVVK